MFALLATIATALTVFLRVAVHARVAVEALASPYRGVPFGVRSRRGWSLRIPPSACVSAGVPGGRGALTTTALVLAALSLAISMTTLSARTVRSRCPSSPSARRPSPRSQPAHPLSASVFS